jgi:hypothetical protein
MAAVPELGPEVVLDVEVRGGVTLLVLANTGTLTGFEPRVQFDVPLRGVDGILVSDLPLWTSLPMLRPGHQVEALLDIHGARRGAPQRFSAAVTFRDGQGEQRQRTFAHDLTVYDGVPTLVEGSGHD